jgi:hypothetical protein
MPSRSSVVEGKFYILSCPGENFRYPFQFLGCKYPLKIKCKKKLSAIKKAFLLIFIFVLGVDALYHLQRFLQCIKYTVPEFTPSIALPDSPSPDSWNSFSRYHFCIYTHVYTLFAPCSSSYSYPCHLPPPTGANLPPSPHPHRTCSTLLFCNFVKEKNGICLFKIASK